jgi:hypothetical protein
MFDSDLDLHDTDELLNELGSTNLDPLPAHLDPDRLSPCDFFHDSELMNSMDEDCSEQLVQEADMSASIEICEKDFAPTEEVF